MAPKALRLVWLLSSVLAIACERGRAIGQPCDRGDACESGVCTIGLGYSDAICTQRCRGEGRGTCPQGWTCSGTARKVAAPRNADAPSICVPEATAAGEPGTAAEPTPRFDNEP